MYYEKYKKDKGWLSNKIETTNSNTGKVRDEISEKRKRTITDLRSFSLRKSFYKRINFSHEVREEFPHVEGSFKPVAIVTPEVLKSKLEPIVKASKSGSKVTCEEKKKVVTNTPQLNTKLYTFETTEKTKLDDFNQGSFLEDELLSEDKRS